MSYSFLPFFLIIISIGVIIFIIVRKFPQISLIDVENLPEVKADKRKDEILKKKAEAKAIESRNTLIKKLKPLLSKLKEIQLSFRKYVGNVERKVSQEKGRKAIESKKVVSGVKKESFRTLLREGSVLGEEKNFDSAEKKYLSAIKIDPKGIEAYKGLAGVYVKQNQLEEAKETYDFILHLDKKDADTMTKLAEIAETEKDDKTAVDYYEKAASTDDQNPQRFAKLAEIFNRLGEYDKALEAIAQSVEMEAQNPKYLDMWAEISIMGGHRGEAEKAYTELRLVNPENKKLDLLKDRISKL